MTRYIGFFTLLSSFSFYRNKKHSRRKGYSYLIHTSRDKIEVGMV